MNDGSYFVSYFRRHFVRYLASNDDCSFSCSLASNTDGYRPRSLASSGLVS